MLLNSMDSIEFNAKIPTDLFKLPKYLAYLQGMWGADLLVSSATHPTYTHQGTCYINKLQYDTERNNLFKQPYLNI